MINSGLKTSQEVTDAESLEQVTSDINDIRKKFLKKQSNSMEASAGHQPKVNDFDIESDVKTGTQLREDGNVLSTLVVQELAKQKEADEAAAAVLLAECEEAQRMYSAKQAKIKEKEDQPKNKEIEKIGYETVVSRTVGSLVRLHSVFCCRHFARNLTSQNPNRTISF